MLSNKTPTIISCPSCGSIWNTFLHNACQCGATIKKSMKTAKETLEIVEKKYATSTIVDDTYIPFGVVIEAMEAYKNQADRSNDELIERLEDARYIIKIMYDKIPLADTTARMSTIISEISILLNKLEPQE